jgi:hypothetical protein
MILVDKKWKTIIERRNSGFGYESIIEDYAKRDYFRKGISWHIPTQSLVDLIKTHSPIVSVGCGFGYTEKLAEKEGADIILTDISPDDKNGWCKNEDMKFPADLLKMDAKSAVEEFKDRNVFMAWPPYDNPMAYEVANAMEVGRYLVYVGESHGGCTGDDSFFNILDSKFESIESDAYIPSWSGIYDNVYIYKKVRQ